jgi:hypothetical protein
MARLDEARKRRAGLVESVVLADWFRGLLKRSEVAIERQGER